MQNIFVVQRLPNWWVKIGDFGITKRVSNNDTALRTATGTPYYLAPEVSHYIDTGDDETDTYTNSVDIWSFACVVYQVMALQVPFPNYPRNLLAFCRGAPFPEGPLLTRSSPEGIGFIKSILVPSPDLRPRAQDLIQSEWLQIENVAANDLPAVKILATDLSGIVLPDEPSTINQSQGLFNSNKETTSSIGEDEEELYAFFKQNPNSFPRLSPNAIPRGPISVADVKMTVEKVRKIVTKYNIPPAAVTKVALLAFYDFIILYGMSFVFHLQYRGLADTKN
jgi:serine/threonine protein kinase